MQSTSAKKQTDREVAVQSGLRYMHPEKLTITRTANGRTFAYYDANGKKINDTIILERINALDIPPAYREVHISPFANGHLQATGIDERGRMQYLYHPEWRSVRDANKFHHLLEFGKVLPHVRRTVQKDLNEENDPRKKLLAAIVSIIDKTSIRIGNEEYAKDNQSYGLTTLHNRHAKIHGSEIQFTFRGKHGVEQCIELHNKKLAKIIHNCQELPGYELFEYQDKNGTIHRIESSDVNEYLKALCRADFTAKDFRTWHATALAIKLLLTCSPCTTAAEIKKNSTTVIKEVAKHLGNTAAVCKKAYIHPGVLTLYTKNALSELVTQSKQNSFDDLELKYEEKITLTFLQQYRP
jgi:DNA topoisomerase-1